MKKFLQIFFSGLLAIFIILFGIYIIIFHSPFTQLKELWVTTAMTTYSHQYLAYWFVSEEEIKEIIAKNKVHAPVEEIDLNLIKTDTSKEITLEKKTESNNNEDLNLDLKHKSENEDIDKTLKEKEENLDKNGSKKQVNSKEPYYKDDLIEIYSVEDVGYKGKVMIIKDPSKVFLGLTKYLGEKGQWVMEISENYDAKAGINAGGFSDPNWKGHGGDPMGLVISQNQLIIKNSKTEEYDFIDMTSDEIFDYYNPNTTFNLIGFSDENILILGKYSIKKIQEMKIRDAVEFSPILVLNGKPSKMTGDGGWGIAPRTGIGQRADGSVIFLTIDGRQPTWSIGAGVRHMRDIFVEFGAINASNLDGGTSTTMTLDNEMINKSSSHYGGRKLANAWLVSKK